MPIVSLDEARAQLGYADTQTDDDPEINACVKAITAVVEDYKCETIDVRAITEDVSLWGDTEFWLQSTPLISLSSLISFDGLTTWNLTTLKARPSGQVVVLAGNVPPSGNFTATYQAGYVTVPDNYKRGALIILQHVWETQRGVGGGQAFQGVVGSEETYDPTGMYSIPRKAKEWLGSQGSVFA